MENKNVKDFRVNKKHIVFILINIVGLFVYILGGARLLAYISIAVVFFILGKYTEKAISFVKDYRLQLKVNRMDISYKEVQMIKEENEFLKSLLKQQDERNREKKEITKSFSLEDLELE